MQNRNYFQTVIISLFFLLVSLSISAQHKADSTYKFITVQVPETKIEISIPSVFEYNDVQKCYVFKGAASSLTVKEIRGSSFIKVAAKVDAKYFENLGFAYQSQQNIKTIKGLDGIIYISTAKLKSKETNQELEFEKLMLLAGDETKTVWITVNYPVFAKQALYEIMTKSLLTVSFL
jgi:hypothetical protein